MQRLFCRIALGLPLILPALAHAACPLATGRPVYASAAIDPTTSSFLHHALHRVTATMPVPRKVVIEVRVVAPPNSTPGGYRSLTEAANWLAETIAGTLGARVNSLYGVNDISASANVDRNVYPADAVDRLKAEGFVRMPDELAKILGMKLPAGSVWIKEQPGEAQRRVVKAQVAGSRARIIVEARVCVDDRAGLIAFQDAAFRVHDGGTSPQHHAITYDGAEVQKRHREFLAQARAEAARLTAWLASYRHGVSPEERARMSARQPDDFVVAIPFQFAGMPRTFGVKVAAQSTPIIDEALGR